ncbi:MAG: adenylate/guanylate cyclase domain-containing protein [Chitinophagales bacterium]|nr:adenylate/guanylate cyclase domain-containing protein [Chitinophagales bacterium]
MNLNNTIKSKIFKIIWITIAWTLFSFFQFLNSYGNILEMELDIREINVFSRFNLSILRGVIAGIIGGSAVVFLWERWLRSKPYGWTLKSTFFSYITIFLLISILTNAFFYLNPLNKSGIDTWKEVFSLSFSIRILIPLFSWLIVVILTIIALLVNDKYGPGVFRKFLMGKYFSPRREKRIFMFLDLRASTSTAEKLGEEKYFSFLNDVFKYSTPSILKSNGEIYQYVGDEIIISWELNIGLQNANCIQCFYEIQASLNKKRQYFMNHYKTCPEFKAGVHCGYVMAGEIGVIKREIAFSGDVLNTAARIQAQCNEQGVNLLVSKSLIDSINLAVGLKSREIGAMELRGKKELITLYTLSLNI